MISSSDKIQEVRDNDTKRGTVRKFIALYDPFLFTKLDVYEIVKHLQHERQSMRIDTSADNTHYIIILEHR